MPLTPRQAAILQVVVKEHTREGVPVASETVAQRSELRVSPATIRNDLAELEQEGYILRPHTSAGAVPSDKAYRFYVESLQEPAPPDTELQATIRYRFRRSQPSLEGWSRVAAQLLADLVHCMAIATLPRALESRWKHLDLVSLQEFLALLVMVLQGTRVAQQLLPLRQPATQDQLNVVANKLNATFGGRSRRELEADLGELEPLEGQAANVAVEMLKADERARFPDYYIDGLRHIFSYPELAAGSRPRDVAELLEDRDLMVEVFGDLPQRGTVHVTIGSEHKSERLRPFSVVFAQYGALEQATGILGIVGPRRMEYPSVIAHVRYLSGFMSELVEGVRGRLP